MEAHAGTLATYNGFLELVVPKAFAFYEDDYPDITKVPGDGLCATVRTLLRPRGEGVSPEGSTLRFVPRGASRQLIDAEGATVRIRRHPWDFRRGRRVGVVPAPVETLFGTDWSLAPYELAILWTPDFKAKALGSAVLAAVADLDQPSPAIFARAALPTSNVLNDVWLGRSSDVDDVDDFDDYFGGDESLGTDDPA